MYNLDMDLFNRVFSKPRVEPKPAKERTFWVGLRIGEWLEEVSAPDYERQPIVLVGSSDLLYNRDPVTFHAYTNWGVITGFSIFATQHCPEWEERGTGDIPNISIEIETTLSFAPHNVILTGPSARKLSRLINEGA